MQTDVAARRVGRYVLEDELGRGAMGVVYRAQDPLIHRVVAVKILTASRSLDPAQSSVVRERFLREAQTAGGLDHPNIVRIFDVGQEQETGDLYIVMEYIPGPSLERVMEEDPPSRSRIVELVGQLASALDTAHAQGIVHRDIKPANILFAEDGQAKVTDFGIARITSSRLTQDVRDLGTPVYMSPEQVAGQSIDGRSDLFSLGVICYELLAKKPPFEGKSAVSIAYQIVHSTPPPVARAGIDLPAEIEPVMARILAKDPTQRYQTGRDFHEGLSRALLARREATTPPGARAVIARSAARPRALAWIVGGLLALAVLALWALKRTPHPRWEGREAAVPSPAFPKAVPSTDAIPGVAPRGAPETSAVSEPGDRPAEGVDVAAGSPGAASARAEPPAPKPAASDRPAAAPSRRRDARATASPAAQPPAESIVSMPVVDEPAPPPPPPPAPVAASMAPAMLALTLGHWIMEGSVALSLDGKPIWSGEFSKKKLVPYKNSAWDAIEVPPGRHAVTVKIVSGNGKMYLSESRTFDFAPGEPTEIKVILKDEAVAFKLK